MITVDIIVHNTPLPLSISNTTLLEAFENSHGHLIDFVTIAIEKLKNENNPLITAKLNKIKDGI